jgi:hypothetical protein
VVSRIGLPLSIGLGSARQSRLLLDAVGDLLQQGAARSATGVRPHLSFALCAASSASSMSAAWLRATWQTGWPVIGLMLSK